MDKNGRATGSILIRPCGANNPHQRWTVVAASGAGTRTHAHISMAHDYAHTRTHHAHAHARVHMNTRDAYWYVILYNANAYAHTPALLLNSLPRDSCPRKNDLAWASQTKWFPSI